MSHAGYSHREGRGGGRRGRGSGFRGDSYYGGLAAPWQAVDEKVIALRQSTVATFAAARQVALGGSPEKAAKATELLDQTRKALFRILAEDD
jgi:hypothetical protein